MADLLAAMLLLLGTAAALVASIGIVRLPDSFTRMHSTTLAGTLGVSAALLAVAIHFASGGTTFRALAAILFLLAGQAVAAQLLARAAYLSGIRPGPGTAPDEWEGRTESSAAGDNGEDSGSG